MTLARLQASLDHFVTRMCAMFDKSTEGARWFLVALAYKTPWLKHVLLQCPHPATRKAFSRLIVVRVCGAAWSAWATCANPLSLDATAASPQHVISSLRPKERPRYRKYLLVDVSDVTLPSYYTETRPLSPVCLLLDSLLAFLDGGTIDHYLHNIRE